VTSIRFECEFWFDVFFDNGSVNLNTCDMGLDELCVKYWSQWIPTHACTRWRSLFLSLSLSPSLPLSLFLSFSLTLDFSLPPPSLSQPDTMSLSFTHS